MSRSRLAHEGRDWSSSGAGKQIFGPKSNAARKLFCAGRLVRYRKPISDGQQAKEVFPPAVRFSDNRPAKRCHRAAAESATVLGSSGN
jgi:hypothetical protein